MTEKSKGLILALSCILLWAFIPIVSRLGQNQLDVHQFLFWSSLLSCLSVLALAAITGQMTNLARLKKLDWVKASGLGLLGTYIYYLCLYRGYALGKGMEVLIAQYTWPLFIALISKFILNESLKPNKILALILGFSAIILVFTKGNLDQLGSWNPLLLWVLMGSFCFGLFSVLSKKVSYEPISLTFVYFLAATLVSLPACLIFSEMRWPSSSTWIPLGVNGLFVNGISYVLWIWALRKVEASFIAPLIFLTPILSTVFMILWFKEPFISVYGIAIGLILLAGLLTTLPKRPRNP